MTDENGRDVTIVVPPAVSGVVDQVGLERLAREEEIAYLQDLLREATSQLREHQQVMTSFVNIIASLVHVATSMAGKEDHKLVIDRVIISKFEGAKVVLTETDPLSHDVLVEISERAPHHLLGGFDGSS